MVDARGCRLWEPLLVLLLNLNCWQLSSYRWWRTSASWISWSRRFPTRSTGSSQTKSSQPGTPRRWGFRAAPWNLWRSASSCGHLIGFESLW